MPDAESASNEDEYMKRFAYICLGASLLASFLALSAVAQDKPLGDYARSVRKQRDALDLDMAMRELPPE